MNLNLRAPKLLWLSPQMPVFVVIYKTHDAFEAEAAVPFGTPTPDPSLTCTGLATN